MQFLYINKIILETFLVLNLLARNGGGAIVNMLSVVSWFVNPFNAAYCASKHAALALTDAVRIQLKPQRTHMVGVYAGFIDTDMAAWVGVGRRAQDLAPAGRRAGSGRPADRP